MKSALDLVTRLCDIADALSENRTTQISDEAIRTLRDEVNKARTQLSETDFDVDYEASCLIECIAELSYARSDADRPREDRAVMYINTFRRFLRIDRDIAARRQAAAS